MTDQNKLIQQCNNIISNVIGDIEAVDDAIIDLEEHRYDTISKRFVAFLAALDIDLVSTYIDERTSVTLHCTTCDHLWDMKPYLIKRKKQCPNCGKILKLANKEAELWERSARIIKDKHGKIVKRPHFTPDHVPSIRDEFALQCDKGHTFTRSHHELRRDLWCPICPKMSTTDRVLHNVLSSTHVYGKKITKEQRQKQLGVIASMKGMHLISIKQDDDKYVLQCKECDIRARLTERQILRNRYLCENKCVHGSQYNLSDAFFY